MTEAEEFEARREACEVRYVCDMPDRNARRDYLALVEKHRGQAVATRLARLVTEEWNRRKGTP